MVEGEPGVGGDGRDVAGGDLLDGVEGHALHLLGLEGERPPVHAGEHPPEAAVALVLVVEVEFRLQSRVADAELLLRLALRVLLVRLAGSDDPARG